MINHSESPLGQITNAMTIDVEDYFHVAALSSVISRNEWGRKYPVRVEASTHRILQILNENGVHATFFVLGWVAEKCPQLVKAIAAEGHEIASHGFAHQPANKQSQSTFHADVARSKNMLEDLTSQAVYGYRAPSFSIDHSNPWAFETLHKLGFIYSSSTYPVNHDHYGAPDWPRFKYQRREGIIEIPIPTLTKLGQNIPIGGGGYFRFYPYKLSRYLIRSFHKQTGQPYSFYFHPWEIDPGQPKVANISRKSQFRHYLNLNRMERRLNRLLQDFKWNSMNTVYQLQRHEGNAKSNNTETNSKRIPIMG
ncbi:XrtA system polysaccharide deacetylase [Photobacterium lutimaris]|uniref:Polysaccharide deacetylase n=1 Tax=Photobacterium lutimaris TaxID=388278 RepID=A0A2T3J2U5_9GAMM|nr:XrtA system polysaccharide deacetylase [Photobacterium lutimaris]PSU35586.1 polysaccharide deacetylase [Photobacterium lutimaris]TDR78638.1 polysaccharide deacetylase family protein (PEP-CTERM system associated) [Photobacterium lutimaris]